MIRMSDSIASIATALAKAAAEIEDPEKTAVNPHFRSRYADLAEIVPSVRPVLARHGIAVLQSPGMEDDLLTVTTLLTHTSGEWISGRAMTPIQKADPQGVGSATSYLRRYALLGMLGLAAVDADDDAESAVDRSAPAQSRLPRSGEQPPEDRTVPFGKSKGERMGDQSTDQLLKMRDWCAEKDALKFADLIGGIDQILERRELAAV